MKMMTISEDEYHAHPAIGHSGLCKLMRSPAHYRAWADSPPEPTTAMVLGRAFHYALLEPEKFRAIFAIAPKFDKRTREGREGMEAWSQKNAGKIPLSEDQAESIARMREAVLAHQGAARLLSEGQPELSGFWTDPETGLACKCRPDWLGPEGIVEVKTCCDASLPAFSRSVVNFNYDLQLSMYSEGVKAVTGELHTCFIIGVEKEPPYAVGVYKASEPLIRNGSRKYRAALFLLKWCRENGCWPAYQPNGEIEEIDLPQWAHFFDI